MINTAVILCGGKGTRLKPYTKNIPKPMVLINKKPFLFYLVKQLEKNKFKTVILLTGYKSEFIEQYFLKYNYEFKLKIKIIETPEYFETSLRLKVLKNLLKKRFLLLYGDNFLNFNFSKYQQFINQSKYKFNFIIKQAKKSSELGNISLKNKEIKYHQNRNINYRYLDLGFFSLDATIFKYLSNKNVPFSQVLENLIQLKSFGAYISTGEYLSITNKNKLTITRRKLRKYFDF